MIKQVFTLKTSNGISNSLTVKHELVSLLKLCSSIKHISQLHAQIHALGLHRDSFLVSELVRFCAVSSPAKSLSYARTVVVHCSGDSDTFPWNFLIRGYASSESPREAIWAFAEMRRRGVRPNSLTFPFVFKACSAITGLREGRQVRVDAFKLGHDRDVYVGNTLVHFYGQCKKISGARKVFDEMLGRTIVSWNSVITACVENSKFGDGIEYFLKMRSDGEFEADQTTMVLLLSAAIGLGNLSLGKWVHSQTTVKGIVLNGKLGTALIDTYAKTGALGYAESLFARVGERNVYTWSAMIGGLAQHGRARDALKLFDEMISSSPVTPNHVTFLCLLTACSHGGLVQHARDYLLDMTGGAHGVEPGKAHYGAVVDALVRAGWVEEAHEFTRGMPEAPDAAMWRMLLRSASSGAHAEEAGRRVVEMEPGRADNLVMVANMYARAGMWEEAAGVRREMMGRKRKKPAGESLVEVRGSVRRFLSGYSAVDDDDNDSQAESDRVYELLGLLHLQIKDA